jgi:hypothetical protein
MLQEDEPEVVDPLYLVCQESWATLKSIAKG